MVHAFMTSWTPMQQSLFLGLESLDLLRGGIRSKAENLDDSSLYFIMC